MYCTQVSLYAIAELLSLMKMCFNVVVFGLVLSYFTLVLFA